MATDQLSTTFAALADPTRRAILDRLTEGDATVNELAEPFPITVQAVSRHPRGPGPPGDPRREHGGGPAGQRPPGAVPDHRAGGVAPPQGARARRPDQPRQDRAAQAVATARRAARGRGGVARRLPPLLG